MYTQPGLETGTVNGKKSFSRGSDEEMEEVKQEAPQEKRKMATSQSKPALSRVQVPQLKTLVLNL